MTRQDIKTAKEHFAILFSAYSLYMGILLLKTYRSEWIRWLFIVSLSVLAVALINLATMIADIWPKTKTDGAEDL